MAEEISRPRCPWFECLLLFTAALLVNGVVAYFVDSPGYLDAAYYANGAEFLSRGQWTEPYFWNYAVAPGSLPAPAFTYWQLLPSLIGALGISLFPGLSPFDGAQIPFIILGSCLPLVAYAIALRSGGRRHALLAGLLVVFSGHYLFYWSLPETFTPFALTASLALLAVARGRESETPHAFLLFSFAGIMAAGAHLSRADGLLVCLVCLFLLLFIRPEVPFRRRFSQVVIFLLAYLLAMAPLFWRNFSLFGAPLAPGGLSTVFMRDYNDLFRYPSPLTPTYFLSWGLGPILSSRLSAIGELLKIILGVQTMAFLGPFFLVGLIRRWRQEPFFTAGFFGLALFLAMSLVFTFIGTHGAWLHSAAALMPFILVLAVHGLEDVILWVAKSLPHWRPAIAHRNFGIAFVLIAALMSAFLFLQRLGGGGEGEPWGASADLYREAGEVIRFYDPEPGLRVMTENPPLFYRETGYGGIPLVAGNEEVVMAAMRDFEARYLVLFETIPVELLSFRSGGPSSTGLVMLHESADFSVYVLEE